MKYSLIAPREKSVISSDLRLVLFFFFASIIIVVSTYIFLEFKVYDYVKSRETIAHDLIDFRGKISSVEDEIIVVNKEVALLEHITTNNIVLKDSIKNLFDLIPEDITLTRAYLDERSLILYGVTPNKDIYEYLLLAPLRSIFNRCYTNFQPVGNGWYNFVSTNYLDENSTTKDVE